MAHTKVGLDYFSIDIAYDEKMALLEAEYGVLGFGVIIKILHKIYEQGYYTNWTNEVVLLFARNIGLGYNIVSEIVSAAIKRGIFDKNLFAKYEILTSPKIQENYFKAIERRKEVKVENKYLLVKVEQFFSNDNIIYLDVNIIPENVDEKKQSKVKKSKVKYMREYAPARTDSHALKPTLLEITQYAENSGFNINPELFFNYYEARSWKNVSNWQAALKGWSLREKQFTPQTKQNTSAITAGSSIDKDALDAFIDGQFD